ncbi:putative nucleotide-diphospho-sugar transferase [Simkania sp.]|uniref:putative nucleotide-diphospho-sugar transferase n=1 Tax=Simkania sp. TaxID=34094 RepID=UPI003B525B31
MQPLIVSYYTAGTGYEEEVQNLIASCKKLDLQTDIVPIQSRGSWDKNCCYKPEFLLEKLDEHQRPVVWVDADAIFLKKPTLFDSLECDVALRTYEELPLDHPSKVYTGTVYFSNNEKARSLLKRWAEESQKMLQEEEKEVWDQVSIKQALFGSDVDLFPLPDTYATIYDKQLTPNEDAVILHYQASRLFKKEVNNEVVPFWENEMFSQETRQNFSS